MSIDGNQGYALLVSHEDGNFFLANLSTTRLGDLSVDQLWSNFPLGPNAQILVPSGSVHIDQRPSSKLVWTLVTGFGGTGSGMFVVHLDFPGKKVDFQLARGNSDPAECSVLQQRACSNGTVCQLFTDVVIKNHVITSIDSKETCGT